MKNQTSLMLYFLNMREIESCNNNTAKKALLRKDMSRKIKLYPNKDTESAIIVERIRASFDLEKEENILMFSPLKSEPDITQLLALDNIALPYIENNEMFFSRNKKLIKSPMGFMEPKHTPIAFDKALMFVPMLAFDSDLFRLGRGGGFYDRFISINRDRLYTVGVAFSISKVESVCPDEFDQKLDMIITGDAIL